MFVSILDCDLFCRLWGVSLRVRFWGCFSARSCRAVRAAFGGFAGSNETPSISFSPRCFGLCSPVFQSLHLLTSKTGPPTPTTMWNLESCMRLATHVRCLTTCGSSTETNSSPRFQLLLRLCALMKSTRLHSSTSACCTSTITPGGTLSTATCSKPLSLGLSTRTSSTRMSFPSFVNSP